MWKQIMEEPILKDSNEFHSIWFAQLPFFSSEFHSELSSSQKYTYTTYFFPKKSHS